MSQGEPLNFDAVWERLEIRAPESRRRALSRRQAAESLRIELLAYPQKEWLDRLRGEPRFLSPDLMELLLEECHSALPSDPYRAFCISQTIVELGQLLAAQGLDPDVDVLCRALCLGGQACRLLGDHHGAEALLEKGAFLALDPASLAFFSRALALLRWDQGRTEEAAALLHQAGRRYEELEDTAEKAACLALVGLLYVQQGDVEGAEPLLREATQGLIAQARPSLAAQADLALALCLSLTDRLPEAHSLRESARALYSSVQDEEALFSLFWQEAQVTDALGEPAVAAHLFDAVRLHLLEHGGLPEASLVTIQLGTTLCRLGRRAEIGALASELAAPFEGRPGLDFALNVLDGLSQADLEERLLEVEHWSDLAPTFLLAFRVRGEFPRPMPFV